MIKVSLLKYIPGTGTEVVGVFSIPTSEFLPEVAIFKDEIYTLDFFDVPNQQAAYSHEKNILRLPVAA